MIGTPILGCLTLLYGVRLHQQNYEQYILELLACIFSCKLSN